jgi:hypothetical protein
MAEETWVTEKLRYCEHAGCEVALEADSVFPADHLPDQPARVRIHRCSHSDACCDDERPACVWNGTNPNFDPFKE